SGGLKGGSDTENREVSDLAKNYLEKDLALGPIDDAQKKPTTTIADSFTLQTRQLEETKKKLAKAESDLKQAKADYDQKLAIKEAEVVATKTELDKANKAN